MDKRYGNLAASIGSIMKSYTSTTLIVFNSSKDSIFLECLGFPCHGWDVVNKHMCICESLDKPAKQARMLTGGFEWKCSFHAQETYQLEP